MVNRVAPLSTINAYDLTTSSKGCEKYRIAVIKLKIIVRILREKIKRLFMFIISIRNASARPCESLM
jgi:hypothetical protein